MRMTTSGRELTVVDLFCGAGGLSAGLERAGWTTVTAVDHDENTIETLKATKAAKIRIPGASRRGYLDRTKLICADVSDLRSSDLQPDGVSTSWRPILLAGGPPCQPFSSAGRQQGIADPRGRLFLEFVRLAQELRPSFILFENVRGLVTAKTPDGAPGGVLRLIQTSFEDIGYACRFSLLNSADFGAPQRRVRLFMLASRNRKLPLFPTATHTSDEREGALFGLRPWKTLSDFLREREKPDPDDVVRPSGARAAELAKLEPGTGLKSQGIVEANRPSGHWGYRQDSFVADLSKPSRTIRAATTPDWIREEDGRLRRLTWKECAALQGFPAGWSFQGPVASKFKQIGNAVEGNVAEALGLAIVETAMEERTLKPVSAPWPKYFTERVRYTAMEHTVNGEHRRIAAERAGR